MNQKASLTDTFYDNPTPRAAIALAIGDHQAQQGGGILEFVSELRKADEIVAAYPKMRETLITLLAFLRGGAPLHAGALLFETDETVVDHLRELIRTTPKVES